MTQGECNADAAYFQVTGDLAATAVSTNRPNDTETNALVVTDDLVIESPTAQDLELALAVSANLVTVAESGFGDPARTFGIGRVSIIGNAFGESITLAAQLESVSAIPDPRPISATEEVPFSVPAGTSNHRLDLTIAASATAQARGSFLFVASSTASVLGANVRVLRVQGLGGQPLAPGTRIYSANTGTIYEDVIAVDAPFRLLPGCTDQSAVLYPTAPGTPLGGSMSVSIWWTSSVRVAAFTRVLTSEGHEPGRLVS